VKQGPELPEIEWARNLAALDDDRLRAELSTLPLGRQVEAALSLEWQDRLRLIKNSPAPGDLVGRMPDEEVLLTVKGVGEEDALDVIALTSPTQLQFLLDVELWSRDALDENKIIRWLEYLIGCGEEKVIEFLRTVDRDFLVILLMKLVCLIPHETDAPGPGGTSNIMQDEYFTIISRVPKETENIKLLLRVMRQWDRDVFYSLLFEAFGSGGPELEESALRWRNSRLEEKGLLDFDEAIEIYGYVGEEEAGRLATAGVREPPLSVPLEAPSYPVQLVRSDNLLSRALASITDHDTRNRVRGEIAFAANRLLVADAGNIGDLGAMRRALDRLLSNVNIGIMFLTGTDVEGARDLLVRLPIRDLFQIGVSRTLDLKTRATAIVRKWWSARHDRGFTLLGFPEEGVMTGLMQRIPQYYAAGGRGSVEYRDFRSMDEVERTREVLEEIEAAADACFGILGIPAPADADLGRGAVALGGLEEVDLRNLLATGFINFTVRGVFGITPLDRDNIRAVFETPPGNVEGWRSARRRLRLEAADRFLDWLQGQAEGAGVSWPPLRRFAVKAFGRLEEELGNLRSWDDLDPKYIRSVVMQRETRGDHRG
jgi:hypothetical protein